MEDQIILIDKPTGISSFGVVAKVRGHLRTQYGHKIKVGHTGTLDPFATGLLILLTGKNTKKSSEFLKLDKIYEATLRLGYTSTTGDPEGEIRKFQKEGFEGIGTPAGAIIASEPHEDGRERSVPEKPSFETLRLVLNSFIGKNKQKVPQYSAVKINGQRAYKLARKGKDFETPTREIEIYSIEIINYNYPKLKIRCHVSSGTYIRTLAEDIGTKLGTGAYLTALHRTKIANYDIKDALPLSDFITNS